MLSRNGDLNKSYLTDSTYSALRCIHNPTDNAYLQRLQDIVSPLCQIGLLLEKINYEAYFSVCNSCLVLLEELFASEITCEDIQGDTSQPDPHEKLRSDLSRQKRR